MTTKEPPEPPVVLILLITIGIFIALPMAITPDLFPFILLGLASLMMIITVSTEIAAWVTWLLRRRRR